MTNTERQRAFREQMTARGFVQVNGWVHSTQLTEVNDLIKALRTNKHLTVELVRDVTTGKLAAVRKILR